MVALAILENASHIGVWGVDMATSGEYASQRPSCEHILGIAQGLGISVFVPPESDLLKSAYQYGADDHSPLFIKLTQREGELRQRLAQAQQAKMQAIVQEAAAQGALEQVSYTKTVWLPPHANRDGSPAGVPESNGVVIA